MCVRIPIESQRISPLTAAALQLHAPWRAAGLPVTPSPPRSADPAPQPANSQIRKITAGLCWFNLERYLRSRARLDAGACSVKAQRVAEHENVFVGPGASF